MSPRRPKVRKHRTAIVLPLLHVLKSLKPQQRVILLAHLDDKSRDALYQAIGHVLTTDKIPMRKRLFLKHQLSPHKEDLRFLCSKRHDSECKRRKLTQIGGGPMAHILRAAVPLMLNYYAKRV